MVIDDKSYPLSSANYTPLLTIKKQIVLANTFNHNMNHFVGWKLRMNGNYKRTAAFTIDSKGKIYKHFDPMYHADFFGDKELDKQSIVILLENDGWLLRDIEKNLFITWVGDIYKKPNEVVEKRWRGYNYWSPYTSKQLESAAKLAKSLCVEFFLPISAINHNTKLDDVVNYSGILYKSNFEKHYTDLSPSWDFTGFKNKIELK